MSSEHEYDAGAGNQRNTETYETALAEYGIEYTALSLQEKETLARQQAFLAAYAEAGSIRKAAPAAGITREGVQYWRRHNTLNFEPRMEAAVHEFREHLQDMAIQRITNPVGNRGSDLLLIAMLNAHWPERYRNNVVVVDDRAKEVLEKLAERRKAKLALVKPEQVS